MSELSRTSPGPARILRSWGPGWIWAVPVAALGVAAWLLVRFLTQGGTDITITFPEAHGIDASGTHVEYRGVPVGSVTAVSLAAGGAEVEVKAKMDDSASPLLRAGTTFWLRCAHPSLDDLSSLGAVLSGPTIVMEPGSGAPATRFHGRSRRPAVPAGSGAPVSFAVTLDGPVGDLSPGDPVTLRGFPVGEVRAIGFRYDASSGAVATPVTLGLYPSLFHIDGSAPDSPDALKSAVGRLVTEGLRAQLDREPPVIGGYRIALDMVPGAPAARMDVSSRVPEIPTAAGGGLQSVVARLQGLPLEEIGQRVLAVAKHADQVVSSPQLKESMAQLDQSLRDVHHVLGDIGPKVDRLAHDLSDTAGQLDRLASAADRTLNGAASQAGVQDTLREIRDAARSVRSLADYLERHPESVISGKRGE